MRIAFSWPDMPKREAAACEGKYGQQGGGAPVNGRRDGATARRTGARPAWIVALALVFSFVGCWPALAAPQHHLSDAQFRIGYSASGLTTIRHVHDRYDTNYIARGAALGDLLIRYRALGGRKWKEASAARIDRGAGNDPSAVSYTIGVGVPTIARSSRPSASVRSFALFALGDGIVPKNSRAVGIPAFVWFGRKGTREWVQYDFPKAEKAWSMFSDPKRSGVVLVTLPEEMPVTETLDLLETMRSDLKLPVLEVVVNGVLPPLFSSEERVALLAPRDLDPNQLGDAALAAGARRARREMVQHDALVRLRESVDVPLVYLPHVFADVDSLKAISELASRIH